VHHIAGTTAHLDGQERVDGWRQALAESGALEPAVLPGDWSASSGYEMGRRLATDPEVTAVLCGNDTMALGLMRALAEHGLRVPHDVSIVGFDDVPDAGFYSPPLSTVRQDFGEVGRQALNTLTDRMSGVIEAGLRVRIAPELVIRASTAPPGR
jgi:DNA-binding LacI/PurR family transcriptional regulator